MSLTNVSRRVKYLLVLFSLSLFILWRKTVHLGLNNAKIILTRESASKNIKSEKQLNFFLYYFPRIFLYGIPTVINESKNNVMIQTIL